MHIDKYKQEDGAYKVPMTNDHGEVSLIYFEDAESVLGNMLHFCGCGNPDEALKYVASILKGIDQRRPSDIDIWGDIGDIFELFPNEGQAYFTLYVLDHYEMLEHGSSVGGCWLTEKGRQFIEDVEELYAQQKTRSLDERQSLL